LVNQGKLFKNTHTTWKQNVKSNTFFRLNMSWILMTKILLSHHKNNNNINNNNNIFFKKREIFIIYWFMQYLFILLEPKCRRIVVVITNDCCCCCCCCCCSSPTSGLRLYWLSQGQFHQYFGPQNCIAFGPEILGRSDFHLCLCVRCVSCVSCVSLCVGNSLRNLLGKIIVLKVI